MLNSFEVYSIDSSKMIDKFLKSSTSTGYFSNSTGSSATNRRFFPDIAELVYKSEMGLWSLIMMPHILLYVVCLVSYMMCISLNLVSFGIFVSLILVLAHYVNMS